ncbi:MAG: hypothetical protein ABI388_02075 [Bacteroidia bacterium]
MENSSYEIIDKMELPHTKVELRSDHIIQFFYGDNIQYSMKEAQELEDVVIKISKGSVYMSLRIAGKYSDIDMDVMTYLSKGRGTLFTLADAFVISSFSQKILGNFYLRINKPVQPTKFFNDIKEAEGWLKSLNMQELQQTHKIKTQHLV